MRAYAGCLAGIGHRNAAAVPLAVAMALLLTAFGVPSAATAAKLNVSPKSEQTMMREWQGAISPRKFKYRLWATEGKRAKWTLTKSPRWLVANIVSGTAKATKSVVAFSAKKSKINRMEPGIYQTRIKFGYTDGDANRTVRRNVTLIVEGTPSEGAVVFNNKCIGCHDLDYNKNAPYLHDVYGRRAGTAKGFDYSDALKAYGQIWEERNLNAWLTNPQKLVKGADMFLSLKKAEDRMNVISFLKANAP